MEERIRDLLSRYEELEHQLADPATFADQKLYRHLTQEHAYLSEIKALHEERAAVQKSITEHQALLSVEKDEEILVLLREEIASLTKRDEELFSKLQNLLVPPDPEDSRNVILELRAGTGGDEAALFVGDCVRMYQLYAQKQGWRWELLSCNPSDLGGFREYIMGVSGPNVKRFLQYEAGTHRVQRIPETEASGRIHTSAITIAILVEPSEEEEIKIDEKELKIDTYRSSGAGGQHVNVTDSAVRITHLPSGIVVACQEERSQHKNKDKAMRLLKAKLAEERRRKAAEETAALRAAQVGSGDRSERIRTYNFPQNRVTEHRIHFTSHNLKDVLDGELHPITSALVAHYYQEKMGS